jgi:beta-galactosidase
VSIHFGVDYYPEHWPESRWETDARLMQEMGIGVVRLAEFSWRKMEDARGSFDFSWLDKILGILGKRGIKAIIGTPTAAPPAWLIEEHPEILPVDSRGVTRGFGGRHHDCQSNAVYRERAARIVRAMARHFATSPNVIGWQIDNELGNSHDDLCHCPSCRAAFQAWLKKKYGTIEELNRRWGTAFWSQGYDDFGQVPTPAANPVMKHSPSLHLDWKRFHSDLIVDFAEAEEAIIREEAPGQPITHNFMGFFDLIDYFKLAEGLDFVSHDQYPMGFFDDPQPMKDPATLAANLDLMAGLKRKSFWIMEQQAGATGWDILGRTPRPGQLALWTAQSVAHGADAVVFFRWRSCTVGTEQYWHGILPHSGEPGHRYAELKRCIGELSSAMDDFRGALSGAEAAILFSYEEDWALQIQPHHPDLDYIKHLMGYYRAFHERNVPVDFISGKEELGRYKLIIAPLIFLDLPGIRERLVAYVKEGGRLVLTMRSGVKNGDNVCLTDGPLPGPFAELLGIEVADYDCLRDVDQGVAMEGTKDDGRFWWDVVEPRGATVMAKGTGGDHDGEPAITVNRAGQGLAYYVGTELGEKTMETFMARVLDEASVASLGQGASGVELARRRGSDYDYIFALNHTKEAKSLIVDPSWESRIGTGEIGPYGFSLFRAAAQGR